MIAFQQLEIYPPSIGNYEWLNYYSHVFDYVEVDSSFYRIPNVFTVKNWYKKTPKSFRFTAKFPSVITHKKRLMDVDNELEQFFEAIDPLSDKMLALLIQLPPSLQIFEGLEDILVRKSRLTRANAILPANVFDDQCRSHLKKEWGILPHLVWKIGL